MARNPGSWMPGTTGPAIGNWTVSGPISTGVYTPLPTTPTTPVTPDTSLQVQETADREAMARQLQQQDYENQIRAAERTQRDMSATETLRGILQSYGLNGLFAKVKEFIQQGYDPDAIMILIRTTPEYKQRFPAMDALAAKGRAISEGEYISYEQTASTLERRYGLPQGMLMGNVTNLLTNEVSASELNDRVILASSASIQAPQELKNQFQQYYGIDQGGLTAYFLDPAIATPLLEKQYASAIIGTEATRQGIGLDVYGAENLQSLGITQEAARQGFGTVAASKELETGRGDVVTQQELISGTLAGNEQARQNIERAAMGRVGRFQGGGTFAQTQQGVTGLGSATR